MAVVIAFTIYFMVKYRYRGGEWKETPLDPGHEFKSRWREAIVFGAISFVVLFGLAMVSFGLASNIQNPPSTTNVFVIKVTAFQWNFRFTYPNGYSEVGVCNVPAGRRVIFNVTSSDVMHNYGLPAFKLKIDAIPGKYNQLWIDTPPLSGNQTLTYQIRCYELCGTGHTFMISNLVDMSQTAFDAWYKATGMNMRPGG